MTAKNYTKKVAKDFNILTRLYQFYALYVLFLPMANTFYKFKIEKLKKDYNNKPYIFSGNHISYFDPFLVAMAANQKIGFMAKIELFQNSNYVAKNISRLGAFAVNREKPDISTIKTVKEVAKAKWGLCIFPQGSIRKNKKIEHINKGFAVMAKMMKYDIVPVGITGYEKYNWNIFKRQNIDVKTGTPISWELDEDEIIRQWKEQIINLTNYELVNDEIKEEVKV